MMARPLPARRPIAAGGGLHGAGRAPTEAEIVAVSDSPGFDDHEAVIFCNDDDAGLRAIIAIHSTVLGPALGGCRVWSYASDDEALTDVLRLSRAMTYKHALAETGQGGGKCVVIADAGRDKTRALFHALGRFVDDLGGRYVIAEDVGTSVEDIAMVREVTPHVAGLADGGSGDPSPVTAYGVLVGLKAAVRHRLGRGDLAGLKVAVQGLGHVGAALCGQLHEAGVALFVSDLDGDRERSAAEAFGAQVVAGDAIYGLDVEVFAPCALGGILNDATVPELRAAIVAGAANNQLENARHGAALAARGILYAPDYVINAGGIINISFEGDGYDPARAMARTEGIHETLLRIFEVADAEGQPTNAVADRLARERIAAAGE